MKYFSMALLINNGFILENLCFRTFGHFQNKFHLQSLIKLTKLNMLMYLNWDTSLHNNVQLRAKEELGCALYS